MPEPALKAVFTINYFFGNGAKRISRKPGAMKQNYLADKRYI